MSIAEDDFLFLSRQLINGGNETSWRCAASRAYYSAYHACVSWHAQLRAPGFVGAGGVGVHQQLINQLRNPAPENSEEDKVKSKLVSSALSALRANRTDADYNLTYDFEHGLAVNVIARAEAIVEKLRIIDPAKTSENSMQLNPTSPNSNAGLRRLK